MTATKHDTGKPRMALLPFDALEIVAKVLTCGAETYGDHNWRGGFDWERLESSMLRHYTAHQKGIDIDPQFGLPHLAHMACCALFLLAHQINGYGTDTRYRKEDKESEKDPKRV